MIVRACLVLLRAVARGLARLTGRPSRRVRVVRLLPHGGPGGRALPLRVVDDARRSGGSRRAGPGAR